MMQRTETLVDNTKLPFVSLMLTMCRMWVQHAAELYYFNHDELAASISGLFLQSKRDLIFILINDMI